jgi:hypothetical protein
MSFTYTNTESITFTITHAKHLAAKVATDLKRIQRFYDEPSDARITALEEELVALLKNGYLEKVTYGFKRNGNWIKPSLHYTSHELNQADGTDDDPGKVRPGEDVTGAIFYTFLEKNKSFYNLSAEEQERFNSSLPFRRSDAPTPGAEGYFSRDLSYSSGGRALNRSTLNSY